MGTSEIVARLRLALRDRPEIAFAYLHGSAAEPGDSRDVDVAVYLRPESYARFAAGSGISLEFAIPLEMRLEADLKRPVDVQVLNRAPLPFRARVIGQGRVVIDNEPAERADFEYRSRYEYFDFQPRRKEYLAEALT